MARAFQRRDGQLVAWLDVDERAVVAQLAEQVRAIVAPVADDQGEGGSAGPGEPEDPFDAIVAGLGFLYQRMPTAYLPDEDQGILLAQIMKYSGEFDLISSDFMRNIYDSCILHDIGKAVDHEIEGTHVQIGVDLLKKYKESAAVIHAVAAHHGDIEATSVEAVLVQAADAISSARPGARRESLENYVKRIEKLETIANSFNGVEQSYAIQAGREIRVMVKPEVVDDTTTVFLAKEIANKLEAELEYPGQIKVTVVREIRSVDYAK